MRLAIGGIAQESQSFSPVPGSWEHFGPGEVLRHAQLFSKYAGTGSEIGGALEQARALGVDLAPTFYAEASASAGHVERAVFEALRDELVARLIAVGPVDGVLLVLHGAMVADGYPDATGEVLAAVRSALGPGLPIVGTLDLHANVTQRMVEQATALVGYHTAPHVDMAETAQRGLRLLAEAAAGRARPTAALRRLPMILPGETARTTDGPYHEVMELTKALMARPGILDASAFSVQPWLDIPDVGCSVLVVADGDPALAEQEADRLADAFWARRRQFAVELTPTTEAIQQALSAERGPWVLADSADAPTSGAPGDSTAVLQALLQANPQADCLHNIVDAPAVARMVEAGVGNQVTLAIGARAAPAFYAPITVSGRVRLIADGEFVQKGPGFHGAVCYRGRTVVLQIGRIFLVVMERPVRQWDPELYRSLGLEPRDARIVVVKSPAAFRAAYAPFAAEILVLDAPGVCSPALAALPFRHVRRPLFPLDDPKDWRGVGS